jgi:hypothetical protein
MNSFQNDLISHRPASAQGFGAAKPTRTHTDQPSQKATAGKRVGFFVRATCPDKSSARCALLIYFLQKIDIYEA